MKTLWQASGWDEVGGRRQTPDPEDVMDEEPQASCAFPDMELVSELGI